MIDDTAQQKILDKIDSALAFCEGFMNELQAVKKEMTKDAKPRRKTGIAKQEIDRLIARHEAKILRKCKQSQSS